MRSFCKKTYVHKIPRFRGGGYSGFGGGSADFIFMGAGIFLRIVATKQKRFEILVRDTVVQHDLQKHVCASVVTCARSLVALESTKDPSRIHHTKSRANENFCLNVRLGQFSIFNQPPNFHLNQIFM